MVGNLAGIVDEIVDDMSELVAQRARTQVRGGLNWCCLVSVIGADCMYKMDQHYQPTSQTTQIKPPKTRAVLDFLGRRPGERHGQMVGSVTESRFEGIRLEVLSKLQVDVKDVMASYEKGACVVGVFCV